MLLIVSVGRVIGRYSYTDGQAPRSPDRVRGIAAHGHLELLDPRVWALSRQSSEH